MLSLLKLFITNQTNNIYVEYVSLSEQSAEYCALRPVSQPDAGASSVSYTGEPTKFVVQ